MTADVLLECSMPTTPEQPITYHIISQDHSSVTDQVLKDNVMIIITIDIKFYVLRAPLLS